MDEQQRRARFTKDKLTSLDTYMNEAKSLIGEDACVYATGSFGRLEASEYSDLDLFIVGLPKSTDRSDADYMESRLSRLNEICIKADLIEATRALRIQEFDGDGRYLVHYPVRQLVGSLGTPEDDANNTFTARLLMLLEGRALIGLKPYEEAIGDIIAAYWRDYEDHKSSFLPAFLANDILRLWRTFCVNYEARTANIPREKNLKRRLKNYKLKHSRLLTCYSALLAMTHSFNEKETLSPQDMFHICGMTPIERIQSLLETSTAQQSHVALSRALSKYVQFLEVTNEPEALLLKKFDDSKMRSNLMQDSYAFAEAIFEALQQIGSGSRMHRVLLV